MVKDRLSRIVEQLGYVTSARRKADILREIPESFEIDMPFDADALEESFVPSHEELAAAAEQIEQEWAQRFAPITPFDDLEPQVRALWEGYAIRNCSHLSEVPEGHVEALYLESNGETPVFVRDQAYRDSEEFCPQTLPRFSQDQTPYVEEYFSIDEMPITRLKEMGRTSIEFPIPREVRVFEENTPVTLSKGRAWPMWAVLIEGKLQSLKVLEQLAWAEGKNVGNGYHVSLDEVPNRCFLVEVWENRGDDGHMQHERTGFAVMTQVQFAEYLDQLSNRRYRRHEKSEAQRILERFPAK